MNADIIVFALLSVPVQRGGSVAAVLGGGSVAAVLGPGLVGPGEMSPWDLWWLLKGQESGWLPLLILFARQLQRYPQGGGGGVGGWGKAFEGSC